MAIFTLSALAALVLGGIGLWLSYSLVSIVASGLAVVGGFAVFGLLLRYLVEERPVEIFEDMVLDNIGYAAVSVPAGLLSYRVFEQLASVLSTIVVGLLAVLLVAMFVLGPATVLNALTRFYVLIVGLGDG